MRTLSIIVSVIAALPLSLFAQGPVQQFQSACMAAEKNKKDVMVVFSGSSWNKQSEQFEKEVIGAEAFKKQADELFVRVVFDFPREREKTDTKLLEFRMKYKVRQMPSVVLLDPAGRPFGYAGFMRGGAEEFWKLMKEMVDLRVKRDELFAKGRSKKGLERAKLLVEGLELLPSQVVRDFYVLEMADIAKADPEGKTGFIAKVEKEEALKREQTYYQALFREKKYDEIIKVATKAAQEASGEDSQRLSLYKIQALATLDKFDQAKNAIDAMASIAPDSTLGQRAPQYHQAVERMKARAQKMKEAKTAKPMVKKRTGPIVSKPVAIVSDINELKEEAVMLEKQALEAAQKENELNKLAAVRKSKVAALEKELAVLKEEEAKSKGELEKAVAERSKLATKAQAMKDVIENHEAMEARKRQMRELEEKAKKLKKEADDLKGNSQNLKKSE
ncbi:MAG: thioredoxin family protein [Akkermansiaceae bacterium]|nr:thioredoxin family protein [Akkermansiaceae bacterium]